MLRQWSQEDSLNSHLQLIEVEEVKIETELSTRWAKEYTDESIGKLENIDRLYGNYNKSEAEA